ncbi:PAS domain-containing protein [Halobaculum marinum]|uniref:histidine kinase n=1 Tax=Halobaculum marinum TaxID=3031996 RepID=A0ABD5X2U9_9EURY|nr:PAS domain-containing protein [Halobaculum sp. DT55]
MTDEQTAPLTVLIVVEDQTDHDLLYDWLDDTDGFDPLVGSADDPFDADFDVCVLDVAGVTAHRAALAASREASTTYLPSLLFVPERDGEPAAVLDRLDGDERLIDDTIAAPVQRTALARRIRSLGRARRYSTRLAANRDRIRRLVRYLPDALFVCRDGVVTYANPVAASLLGVDDAVLIDRPFTDLVAAVDREAVEAALAAADERGRGGPVETVLTRAMVRDADGGVEHPTDADGGSETREDVGSAETTDTAGAVASAEVDADAGMVPVEVTTIAVGDETQVLAHDIRERRAREDRLALYRRAMDEATVGITIADHTDDDEVLTYVNNEFKRLTGLTDEEAVGRNPRFLQTDATDPDQVAKLRRAIDAGEEASVVLLNRRADGRTWYNAVDISPIRNADGEVTHYLGFQRDVSDRVARDQRLTVLDRVLRHNIRNRLNVVLGYTDHIEELLAVAEGADRAEGADGADGEDGADGAVTDGVDVTAVRADADHVRAAAMDVLALSDSARRFREEVVDADDADPVDAATVVEEVAARIAAGAPDAEVRLSLPDTTVWVAGAAPLMLVVEELLTNVVEHVVEPTVTVALAVETGEAVVTVSDDGPGITPDSRTALGYGSETPTEHGQGIGLWLVRWTVDAAGGTVAYEDAPGGGARVVARLPTVGERHDGERDTDGDGDGGTHGEDADDTAANGTAKE